MFLIKSGAGGPDQMKRWLELYEFHVRDYGRLYKAHCATLQTHYRSSASSSPVVSPSTSAAGSSSSSASSDVGSGSGCGSSYVEMSSSSARISKGGMKRFVRRMRSKGVASSLPGGLCYTRSVRPEARESAALALGAYPALGDVLSRPREEFLPLAATASLSLSVKDGVAHVDYTGPAVGSPRAVPGALAVVSYNDAVVSLAKRCEFEFGTYGHLLRSSSPVGAVDVGLSLDTPVGSVDLPDGKGVTAARALDPVPWQRALTVAARMLGVRRSVGVDRPWTFVQALHGCEPVQVEFVEEDGRRYTVCVHTDGHSFYGLECSGTGGVMFPLFAQESASRVMEDLYHGAVSDVCYVSREALQGLD